MPHKIIVVDDEPDTRRLLEFILRDGGFEPFGFEDGQSALSAVDDIRPDLAIIDLVMPNMDGIDLVRRLRARTALESVPLLMLTARDHAIDRYEAFAVGVNDYITKPFDPIELIYRVRAFLRRASAGTHATTEAQCPIMLGDIKLDPARFMVTVRGQEVALTRLETAVLHFLMSRPGQVFSAAQLSAGLLEGGRTVDAAHAHVRHLRVKLELDPSEPRIIVTMGRKGYFYNLSGA
jgi:DNA-binding response OmpR family regulator